METARTDALNEALASVLMAPAATPAPAPAFHRLTLYTERMPRHEYTARYGSAKTGLGFL
jgi:hypothetical protein